MMNGIYLQAVKEDRERDLKKHMKLNQIYWRNKDVIENQQATGSSLGLVSRLVKIGNEILSAISTGKNNGVEALD